jgi:hypothetical protein
MMINKDEQMKQVAELTLDLCDILRKNYYKNGSTLDYNFVVEPGRKYLKIVMVNNQKSVHAFVDKKTGDLYKAATWSAPAKGVRFNLLSDIEKLRKIGETTNAMWASGYLYR